jgi:hypothetical protein
MAARGEPYQEWLLFRARLMGAAYGIVSPYLPMLYALTRQRLFTEYGLDWNLGSPRPRWDHDDQMRGRVTMPSRQ